MSSNPEVAYWDSCVFIDRLEARIPERIEILSKMTEAAENGTLKLVTSALTLAEVVKLKNLSETDEVKEKLLVSFFNNDYIFVRNVDPRISEIARTIVRQHNLKPPDAIHVATAIATSHVEVLHTYDSQHLLPLNGKIQMKSEPGRFLRIEEPHWAWQRSLRTSQ